MSFGITKSGKAILPYASDVSSALGNSAKQNHFNMLNHTKLNFIYYIFQVLLYMFNNNFNFKFNNIYKPQMELWIFMFYL